MIARGIKMSRPNISVFSVSSVAFVVSVVSVALTATLVAAQVSLRITEEIAPPGGIAQVKLEVTEPRPISTGRVSIDFGDLDEFVGINVLSPTDDAFGVAQIRGSGIRFAINSPSGGAGTDSDYPILTIAARVPPTASLGTVLPVTLPSTGIRFVGRNGEVYKTEVEDGSVTVANHISIDDVIPGSAKVPAGGVVTVIGRGFKPTTRVRLGEAELSEVRYIDPTHMQVVLEEPARMHGIRVRAENKDGPRTEYFSYQRTHRQDTSEFPVLNEAVPLFPLRLMTKARVDITAVSTALALQNIKNATAAVRLELLSPAGEILATTSTSVAPNRFKLREISEWFGISYSTPSSVRVRSSVPIQVLGIHVNTSGDAAAIAPR
jgi:hypothetical protein